MPEIRPADLINQVEYWTTAPDSPLMVDVRKQLQPLEDRASQLDPKSSEFQKANADYQKQAAALLLGKIQQQFGGNIPGRKQMEDQDFAQRAGGDPAAEAQLRQAGQPPFMRGYNILEQLQKIAGSQEATPASLVEPGVGGVTKLAKPSSARAMPRQGKPPETDDEKLTDTQLALLYGMAGAGGKQMPDFYNAEDPALAARLPYEPAEAQPRSSMDATPEQLRMEDYKKAFEHHEMNTVPGGQGPTYANMPLPPGWARDPSGVPITSPSESANGRTKEAVEDDIRRNMMRMLMTDSGALKDE